MIYQVIMQDDWLEMYHVSIGEEDLVPYPSAFCECFDKEIEIDEGAGCVYVRGFIFNKEELQECLEKIMC